MPAAEPAGISSVACSSCAGHGSPAQPGAARCMVQSAAPQTWRAPELSPVVQLGQPSAVGVAVPPKTSLCDGKAQACSAQCPRVLSRQTVPLLHGVPRVQCGNSRE